MSADSEDEDFADYGNPLDPLDEESLPRKKAPSLRDQIATDSHGRRRFHGAFTGGFSAGFFNSVGSLEGWTPSTFKSSRSDKAKAEKQRPEDFMDEEDMDEFGIAPKVLRATSEFNDSSLKRKKNSLLSDGPIPGEPVLNDLLPARETVGTKLLMKMGWKPGQGTGPRVTKAQKKQMQKEYSKSKTKVYGCSLPQDISESKLPESDSNCSSDDENYEDVTFAPEDFESTVCKPKENCFGLGYSGLDRRPILSGHVSLFEPTALRIQEKKKKILIAGQAFGVGAFEEDDEDIYSKEDMSQYDFALESAPSSSKQSQQLKGSDSLPNYAGAILEGFILGRNSENLKKYFPPPSLPQGFRPIHSSRKSRFEPIDPKESSVHIIAKQSQESKKKGPQHHLITAVERATILEEPLLKPEPQNAENLINNEESNLSTGKTNNVEKVAVTRKQGYSNFRPFAADAEKEKRYEQFLELSKKGQKDRLSYYQPITMTEWEKERERVEFEQAARLYQPLSGIMSDRFVSASQPEDLNSPMLPIPEPIDQDSEKRAAAKMKMFGRLTREEFDWRPCSLLCKRFNVPELFPGSGESSNSSRKPSRFSVFDFLDAATSNKTQICADSPAVDKEIDKGICEIVIKQEEQEESGSTPKLEVLSEQNDESLLEFPDPPDKVDLFKAIFLSSSEDSDNDNDEAEQEETTDATLSTTNSMNIEFNVTEIREESICPAEDTKSSVVNVQRNLSPPRGVFANLDLDIINIRRKEKSNNKLEESDTVCISDKNEVADNVLQNKDTINLNSEEVYGPTLPAALSQTQSIAEASTLNKVISKEDAPINCEWVEKINKNIHREKHKKHKKPSKHKKHKSKSKHKKKKH